MNEPVMSMEDVKALDISKYLGPNRVRNRVKKAGIELEGGWIRFPVGETFVNDMSVFKNAPTKDRLKIKELRINKLGELPSQPMIPARIPLWMRKVYPDLVNESCGLHVHMSFGDLRYYADLIQPEYQKTMIAYVKEWAISEKLPDKHPIWARLCGSNEFCKEQFFGDRQLRDRRKDYDHFREGNRYTAIAYRFGVHKTIECRLLPMFETPDLSTKAVKRVIEITNACLVKIVKRHKPDEVVVEGPSLRDGIVERDSEVI